MSPATLRGLIAGLQTDTATGRPGDRTRPDGSLLLAIPIAFIAGLVSFLSPCVLPLAPGYLAYVAGLTGADPAPARRSPSAATITVDAAATVSATPAAAGAAPGTANLGPDREPRRRRRPRPRYAREREVCGPRAAGGEARGGSCWEPCSSSSGSPRSLCRSGLLFGGLGGWLLEHQRTISVVLGAAVVVLGLGFLGLPALSRTWWWNRDRRSTWRPPTGLRGAPLLGVVFGLGWTPCIGPTLAAVQTLAFTEASAARGAAPAPPTASAWDCRSCSSPGGCAGRQARWPGPAPTTAPSRWPVASSW